jgi:hypothetical protein
MMILGLTLHSGLGVDWQSGQGYRIATLAIPANGRAGFTEMAPASTGIRFTNILSEERGLTNQIYLNGSGVAAGDVDGDGWCDLYFCGLDSANVLYRNLGDWRFEDISAAAGVACVGQASTGAAFADVDGDGDLDLLVNGVGSGTRLFLNDGHGKFSEFTDESGLRSRAGSASLALADVDGDGLLDLYVVNYRTDTMRDKPEMHFRVGVTNGVYHLLSVDGQASASPNLVGRYSIEGGSTVLENGEPDIFFHNLGKGRFEARSWTNGVFMDEKGVSVAMPYDWGLSAMFHDMNGDGTPDLYVCNDFQSPDRIWINDGHGRFKALARDALPHTSLFSMGVDFADIDRDGYDDFFVADMLSREHARRQVQVMDAMAFAQARRPTKDRPQVSHNTLFHNRGNGSYAEIAQLSGIDASDWSWCPAFVDVDLDGYEDLLITTGHWRDSQNADVANEIEEEKKRRSLSPLDQIRLRRRFPRLETPKAAFRNRGDLSFEDVSKAWGFDSRRVAHGMVLADLDNDGDLDVIMNCLNNAPLLYRNDCAAARIAVRLRGKPPNTFGIGAKVSIVAATLPKQSAEFHCGGRYLSSDDFIRTFAAGNVTNLLAVEVLWRSGGQTIISNVAPNQLVEIDEDSKRAVLASAPVPAKPLFEDISSLLKHEHKDESFDDFARQPLLPNKLSDLGPGVTWFDFNGDGWEDLIIGTGRGGRLAVFRNDGKGGLIPQRSKLLEAPLRNDTTTVLGWQPNATNVILVMGLSTYEQPGTNSLNLRQLSVVTAADKSMNVASSGSAGPLALGDIDGDGDLDLFVGARVVPGRFPEGGRSGLLKNDRGELKVDQDATREVGEAGMVSGAIFTDLDGDGLPELVLACEWGPIRIFQNNSGHFTEWNATVHSSTVISGTLSQLTGRWNSVAAGDFDGDGRLDIVAGNSGRNTPRQRFLQEPIRLYFSSNASVGVNLLEAHFDPLIKKWVPARDWGSLSPYFPEMRERFANYRAFGTASVNEIFGPTLNEMQQVSASTFDSVVLLNRTNYFDLVPLPLEAQSSVVFGIAVGDLNGDGKEDLFLAQNFFGVSDAESRLDSGCGAVLLGDGHGSFRSIPPQESGIMAQGEGRGAALCDFDHDGRLDLAEGQNKGATKLFQNRLAKPGLRIHLEGPEENLHAAGAVVRVVYEDGKLGPAHEAHIGSGYWSQDSTDMVMGLAHAARAIQIRWSGGLKETIPINPGAQTVSRRMPKK